MSQTSFSHPLFVPNFYRQVYDCCIIFDPINHTKKEQFIPEIFVSIVTFEVSVHEHEYIKRL